MVKNFYVDPAILSVFPGVRIAVAVADGVDNRTPRPEVEVAWQAAWLGAEKATEYGNAQSHPRVAPWRERMRDVGVSGKQFPSSIEALLRRAMRGGEPFRINPLVDFYNAVSLRHVVPAGGFDLGGITGPLELRLTRDGDTFQALDDEAPIPLPPGEIAYAAGSTILTRHFVWRQAREALITESTRHVMLLSEVLGEVGDVAGEVLEDFRAGIAEHFGVEPRCSLASAQRPSISWD
jgi:DNA/RNA-binding domain of Phe-tRNA-synthetase-like protein